MGHLSTAYRFWSFRSVSDTKVPTFDDILYITSVKLVVSSETFINASILNRPFQFLHSNGSRAHIM